MWHNVKQLPSPLPVSAMLPLPSRCVTSSWMHAGKAAPYHLATALDKTVAMWAGGAMLQFLFLLLHNLWIAQSRSGDPAQGQHQTVAADRLHILSQKLSHGTYADVLLTTPDQVKDLIGELLFCLH